MKRLLHLAARVYPAAWRRRYGVEFRALLDENAPRWHDMADILIGGLQMRLAHTRPAIAVMAFGAAGAIAAAGIALATVGRFVSTGTMHIQPAARPAAAAVVRLEVTSADARQAQHVAADLMSRIVEANMTRSASEPPGTVVQIIDPSAEPRTAVPPRRIAAAGIGGLGGGALVGMLFGRRRRRPSPTTS
jgi:hypothetical protein